MTNKTLVAWVKLANLEQRGAGILGIEQWTPGHIDVSNNPFDTIVFGEVATRRWMAGSDEHKRTAKTQDTWPEESADPQTVIQIAAVYRGKQVTLLRNGQPYASYTADSRQTFTPPFLVLVGRRHVGGTTGHFAGSVLDARVYDRALKPEQVAALAIGLPSKPVPLGWWCFADAQPKDRMGHFETTVLKGGARIDNGELLLDGKGAMLVAAVNAPTERDTLRTVPSVPAEPIRVARLLRERFLADPYRPGYHFATIEDMAMPGDPNGAFYHNGRYHLMYLYARRGAGFCWGHMSSTDLVHWRHHPDALAPDDVLDAGIFSGGAFVDDDGIAYLTYWKVGEPTGIAIGASRDHGFDRWEKFGHPVIASTEWGVTEMKDANGRPFFVGSADPSNIWKQDGRYYMLTGNLLVLNKLGRGEDAPMSEQGDRLYLFVSDDLKRWQYLHPFYERNPEWTDQGEDNMCPSFMPLPSSPDGGAPSGKHLLLFIAHNRGCQYYIGDYRDDRFFPERHGRMSWVDTTYFAPEALMDGKGRQIMWAWLMAERNPMQEDGWSGVYGLPRTLWLAADGTLCMRPVPELECLRMNEHTWNDVTLDSGATKRLEGVVGHSCELQLDIEPGAAKRCGVKVLVSSDEKEETLIYYDAKARQLVVDSTHGGTTGRPAVERAPFELCRDEPLSLRVFVDRSVVEVYANDRQAIGRRVFPEHHDSPGVVLFAEKGRAHFKQVSAWEMMPSNPY